MHLIENEEFPLLSDVSNIEKDCWSNKFSLNAKIELMGAVSWVLKGMNSHKIL